MTVTGITAGSKVYDGTTAATLDLASAVLVGVLDGEDVTLVTTGATGAFADADVGTAKAVNVSGLSLSGAAIGNYTLTQPTATADITAKELTISGLTAENKEYDGTTAATLDLASAVLVGVVDGDSVSLSLEGGTATFADKNVGVGKDVTVTGLSLSGTSAGNYVLATTAADLTADITAKSLSVSGLTADSKVYDGTTAATLSGTASLVGVLDGEDVTLAGTAVGAFADANAGTAKAVNVSGLSLSGADLGNYTLTQPTLTADIAAKELTVTANDATRAAGDPNPTFTVTYTGFVEGETLETSGVTGEPALTTDATEASPAGSYTIFVGLGTLNAENYGFHLVSGVLTVT